MEENTQIQLVQTPVIKHALKQVGQSVTDRLTELNIDNLVATDDTVKGLKRLAADLNKELKEYEEQRKFVKEGVMSPYNEFEGIYKAEISEKYKKAIDTLKEKVAVVENRIKAEKEKAVRTYFEELCSNHGIDFVAFEQTGIDINLSTTEKKYKEQVESIVSGILTDLALIETQENKAETLVEYKRLLNVSEAIINVKKRKEAEAAEKAKIAEQEAPQEQDLFQQPVSAQAPDAISPQVQTQAPPQPSIPTPQPGEKVMTASIKITGTLSQLKAVSEFLKANKIEYINL